VCLSSGDLTQTEIDTILAGHNADRAPYGSPALTWDTSIAATAQSWANGCSHTHSTNSFGENIAYGTNPRTYANSGWRSEQALWTCSTTSLGACNGICGHWTQIVWKNSTRLGCGQAFCNTNSPFNGFPTWYFLVCNFSPAGNIGNRPAVSSCPTSPVAPAPVPVAMPVTQPVSMPVAQPVAMPVAQPVAQPVAMPVAQPVAMPVAQPVAMPVAQPVAQPVAMPVAQPVAQPVTQPVAQPVVAPVTPNATGYRKCLPDPTNSHLNYRYYSGRGSGLTGWTPEECQTTCKGRQFTKFGLEKSTSFYCICYSTEPTVLPTVDSNCDGTCGTGTPCKVGNGLFIAYYA